MATPDRPLGQKWVDNIFSDVPVNIFTSDQGAALGYLSKINETLDRQRELAERSLASSSAALAPIPHGERVPYYLPSPEIIIDTSALADAQRQVAGRLEDVFDAQRTLVKIADAHTPLLENGNMLVSRGNQIASHAAIQAFQQRNKQIDHLSQLVATNRGIIAEVADVGATIEDEAKATRRLLHRLLTDVGSKITEMTGQEILTRMALVQMLYRIRSTFLQTHAEMMLSQQRQQIVAQQQLAAQVMTEKQKESRYQWERAEVARSRARNAQDLDGAFAILAEAQRLDDINPLPYVSAGTIHLTLGHPELASVAFSQADFLLERNPHLSAYTLMNFAESLRLTGRLEHAERAMRRATKLDPGNMEVWFQYGKAAWRAGKKPEAVACMKILLVRNPAYFRAQITVDPKMEEMLPILFPRS